MSILSLPALPASRLFLTTRLLSLLALAALGWRSGAQTVVAWGNNGSGRATVPAGLSGVTSIAAGNAHSLALRNDGTVTAWGNNSNQQSTVPAGLSGVTAIDAASYSVAVKEDATLVQWGYSPHPLPGDLSGVMSTACGRQFNMALLGNGTVIVSADDNSTVAIVPPGLAGVVGIAAGDFHALALKSDGTVVSWGLQTTVPPAATDLVAIAAGGAHNLGLKSDGTVVAWGTDADPAYRTFVPPGLSGVVAISTGNEHSLVLRSDGTVVSWKGPNSFGMTAAPADLASVAAISAGESHAMALVSVPEAAPRLTMPANVLVGTAGFGSAYCRLAAANGPVSFSATGFPPGLSLNEVTGVVSGVPQSAGAFPVTITATNAAGSDTRVVTMHLSGQPVFIGFTKSQFELGVAAAATVQTIWNPTEVSATGLPPGLTMSPAGVVSGTPTAPGSYDVILQLTNASGETEAVWPVHITPVVQWGPNNFGVAPGLTDAVALTSGFGRTLAQRKNGRVAAWSNGTWGDFAVVPAELANVAAVAVGYEHSAAVRTDGTVAVWGHNNYGQLNVPAGLTDVAGLAAGRYGTLALKTDGTVAAWGQNYQNVLSVPPGLSDVVALAVGETQSMALKADGTVVRWGSDVNGALAIYAGPSGTRSIAAGTHAAVSLRSDGTVVVEGSPNYVPAGLTNVAAVSASLPGDILTALKSDGSIVVWGYGPTWPYTPPLPPAGMSPAAAIAAGQYSSAALFGSPGGPPRICGPGVVVMGAVTVGQAYYRLPLLNAPATFTSTPLPAGLLLNASTGEITGAATVAGTFPVDFTATSATGSDTRTIRLVIHGQPRYLDEARSEFPLGVPLSRAIRLGGKPVVTADGLPPGLTMDSSGRLSGTPECPGTYNVRLHLTNALGAQDVTWTAAIPPVVAWGRSYDGINPAFPPGLTDTVAIAAGNQRAYVLRSDGTVAGWGWHFRSDPSLPSGLQNVIAIAADESRSAAMRNDGSVVTWGAQTTGRYAPPDWIRGMVAVAGSLTLSREGTVIQLSNNGETVPGLSGVVAIAEGNYVSSHYLALKANGTVVAWGDNSEGQTNVPAGLAGVVAIAAGPMSSLALKRDGTVVVWGGVWDDVTYTFDCWCDAPPAPPELDRVVAIAAGGSHFLALRDDGTVVAWGVPGSALQVPAGLCGVVAIAAGGDDSLVLAGGGAAPPRILSPLTALGDITGGGGFYYRPVATGGGVSYTVSGLPAGLNFDAATGIISGTTTAPGTHHVMLTATNAFGSDARTLTIVMNGNAGFAGASRSIFSLHQPAAATVFGAAGSTLTSVSGLPPGMTLSNNGTVGGLPMRPGEYEVTLQFTNSFGAGTGLWHMEVTPVVVWGSNFHATLITGLQEVTAVAAGGTRNLALKRDGTVVAWGSGTSDVPPGLSRVTALSAAQFHTLALTSAGAVVGWGYTTVPPGLKGIVSIGTGGYVSYAVRHDGTLTAWRTDAYGPPAPPVWLSDVVAADGGSNFSIALRRDGSVVTWGSGAAVPEGLSGVVAIACSNYHSLALKNDGTVATWGSSAPPVLAGLGSVVAIAAAGNRRSMALRNDGTLFTWGSGTPQLSMSGCIAIDCGEEHDIALLGTLPYGEFLGARAGAALTWQAPPFLTVQNYQATGLPPGLTWNAGTRTLTGTLAQAGSYLIPLTADSGGIQLTGDLTIAVAPPVPDPAAAAAAYSAWVASKWPGGAALTAPGEDFDADGVLNLMEWATGGDPKAASVPPVTAGRDAEGRLFLELDVTPAAWSNAVLSGQFADEPDFTGLASAPALPASGTLRDGMIRIRCSDPDAGQARRIARAAVALP